MEWFFLEALVALVALLLIVAWTMLPGRRRKESDRRARGAEDSEVP